MKKMHIDEVESGKVWMYVAARHLHDYIKTENQLF